MSDDPTPVYVFATDVQKALGWANDNPAKHKLGYKKTIRLMRRCNILIRRAGRWVTTQDLLMTEMPEVWDRIAQKAVEFELL